MKPYICGCIFARGGSKGIPRKNLCILDGKPLIAHAIKSALDCKSIDRVFVSTDSHEIADVARKYGAEIPFMRPAELANDESAEWMAWKHAIEEIEPQLNRKMDIFVSLPPTAPLRSVEDVEACINAFIENDADIIITVRRASRHPSFNMVRLDEKGFAELVMPVEHKIVRRQEVSDVYDMTTVAYVSSPEFILRSDAIFDGRVLAVVIPDERAIDIDTQLDFDFAEFLINKTKP